MNVAVGVGGSRVAVKVGGRVSVGSAIWLLPHPVSKTMTTRDNSIMDLFTSNPPQYYELCIHYIENKLFPNFS